MALQLTWKRLIVVRGLQFALLALGLGGLWWFDPCQFRDPVACLGKYLSLAMAGCGLTWIVGISLHRWLELLLLALVSGFLACFIHLAGMRQFGGFDHSALIDAGWRQLQGQRPYEDFLCSFPAGFLLGTKWAFQLWGVNWAALLHLTAIYAVLTFVWCYFLLRTLRWPPLVSLLLALAAQAATQLLASYWWYNPLVSMSAILFWLSCLVFWERPRSTAGMASLAAALAMLSLMKPNVAPLIGLSLLLLATSRRHAGRLLLCLAAAGGAVWGIARWGTFDLGAMLATYRQAAGARGSPFTHHPFGDLGKYEQAVTYLLAGCLLACVAERIKQFVLSSRAKNVPTDSRAGAGGWPKAAWRPLLLGASCVLTGAFLLQTNSDLKFTEMAMIMVPAFLLLFAEDERRAPQASRWSNRRLKAARFMVMSVVLLVTIGSVTWGWQRVRVFAVGNRTFFEEPAQMHGAQPFFRSMCFGPRFQRVLQQITAVLGQYPRAKVFFGPRMEFGYAVFNKPSPPRLPIVWDPGGMYPFGMDGEIVERFQAARFELLIFLAGDFTSVPQAILDDIDRHYRPLTSPALDELSVYVARD